MTLLGIIVKALEELARIIVFVADKTKAGEYLPLLLLVIVVLVLMDRDIIRVGLVLLIITLLAKVVIK